DTSGNLIEANSEMDTFGLQYSTVTRSKILPDISYAGSTQLNDSTYCALIYNVTNSLTLDPTWVFFNDKGKIFKTRKAWMYRDSVNNPVLFDKRLRGLTKKKDGKGFFGITIARDSIDFYMIEFDLEMFVTHVFPIISITGDDYYSGLECFVENNDHSFYTLHSIWDITSTFFHGSLVCKLDSNGNLLSNGPLFPVGIQEVKNLSGLLLYPNPSANQVTLKYESKGELNLEVYSVAGKLLDQTSFSETLSYDLSNKPKGIYWFKCTDKNGASETKKVVHY
ncbi:MAG: T9SS type A sorting domain-containing protein, partial [Bacteroidota bacterium]|nr:T9SS type A sorting domain-containing protein [Bacteroidota bacterium]